MTGRDNPEKIFRMWEEYKQTWKVNFVRDAGGRTGISALLFYARCLLVIVGLHFAFFTALIVLAMVVVHCHFLPAQEVGQITGIILLGWIGLSLAFGLTKSGLNFVTYVGDKIEKSIIDAFNALREFPMQPSPQIAKFICTNEAAGSFIPSAPFIPPRSHLS